MAAVLLRPRAATVRRDRYRGDGSHGSIPLVDVSGAPWPRAPEEPPLLARIGPRPPACDGRGRCKVLLRLPDLPELADGRASLQMPAGSGWLDLPLEVRWDPSRRGGGYIATATLELGVDGRGQELNLAECRIVVVG